MTLSLFLLLACLLCTWRYTLLDPLCVLLDRLNVSLPAEAAPRLYGLLERLMGVSTQGVVLLLLAAGVFFLIRRLRCRKTVCLLLWAAAALRLLLPVQMPSPLSLFNLDYFSDIQSYAERDLSHEFTGDYQYTVPGSENADAALADGAEIVPENNSKDPNQLIYYYKDSSTGEISAAVSREARFGGAIALVWAGGTALGLGYSVISYLLLRRRLRFAVKDENLPGVWYSDRISTPCVVGFFRPRIYLTFGLSQQETAHILAHERQHIKNGDHWWKLAAWLVVCLHWLTIHPLLLLLAYRVFLRNLEENCDQRVLLELGEGQRADYAQSLLTLSAGVRFHPGVSPLAFGEGDTRGRVSSILRYKKPLAILTALALTAAAVLGIVLVTDPTGGDSEGDTPTPSRSYIITEVIAQSTFSSSSNESILAQSQGAAVHLSQSCFSVDGAGCVEDAKIRDPIYQDMKLGTTLPNFVVSNAAGEADEPLLSIDLPEGTRGYRVLTSAGQDSGWQVLVLEDCIWVGKWTESGVNGTIGEYSYLFRADPADKGSDFEEQDQGNDWEDLILSWTFPKEPDNYLGNGFPLSFSFSFDSYNVSATGMAYTNTADGLLSGNTFQREGSGRLWWWPYEEGSSTLTEGGSMTVTFWEKEQQVGACSLIFNLTGQTADSVTYSIRATLHGYEGCNWIQDPETGGGELRSADYGTPETVAVWARDLTHDGADEEIRVLSDFDGQVFYVIVSSAQGERLWCDTGAIYHAGQNGIYLYEEDGQSYLMNWTDYGQSGMGSIDYRVFSLSEAGDEIVFRENSLNMEADDPLSVDLDAYRSIRDESIRLLSGSMVLFSSNGDTPLNVYCSTPENIITPTLQEEYLLWWTLEELEEIQARAQGTYTFHGEVVDIFDDHLMVEAQDLWTQPDGYLYYFRVPVEDTSLFQMGDIVQITADGPLYRWNMPDKGTTVTVEITT